MPRLPFRLKVPTAERLTGEGVLHWTSFAFHGMMHFDGVALQLEWSGTATTDEVAGTSVRSETIALPPESVVIPLSRLRSVRLRGGWWRPRLEIAANDVTALSVVPGEEAGRVCCWISRSDRPLARELAAAMRRAALERLPAFTDGAGRLPGSPEPPDGSRRIGHGDTP